MVNPAACEGKTCLQVILLQIGHFFENLCGIQSRREKVKNIADANAHTTNARTSSALFWVGGDAIQQRGHEGILQFILPGASCEMVVCN